MERTSSFGYWIRRRRKALDLTQDVLARQAGYATATIKKIEADERRPSREQAERLAELLKIAPEDRTTFLQMARAERCPDQLPIPAAPAPPSHSISSQHPHNLPAQLTTLIGRRREVAAACTLLRRAELRLLTLTGPGGIGKTRLALQVAAELLEDFADGVYWVSLAPISDPELVATTIAKALGLRESDQRTALQRLKDHLHDKKLLLLLDNFEQIVSAAPLLAELLAAAPTLKALVTSRTALRLCGEHEVAVPPLGLPDREQPAGLEQLVEYEAVQLFVERAQAIKTHFAITFENAAAIIEICRRLDGLPLAIELAAPRVKLFSPQALLARLSSPLALLTAGPRDLPTRQQTLRATIDWSYNLLDEGEKTLFARLGVFVGGCTLEAAQAVCGDCRLQIADCRLEQSDQSRIYNLQFAILEGLASLVDQSLVRQEIQADGEPRFTMLETIREYATERLEASGEAEALRRRHTAYYLALAEMTEPKLRGSQQRAWLMNLDTEHPNFRAALAYLVERSERETALRLGGALWWFWYVRGYWREGQIWLIQALALSSSATLAAQAKALLGAGCLVSMLGDTIWASALHEESVTLYRSLDDRWGLATVFVEQGLTAHIQGNYEQATVLLEQSLVLYRDLDDTWGIARALTELGSMALSQGEYAQAVALLEESLALFRSVGDMERTAEVLGGLGFVVFRRGDCGRATVLLEESLSLRRELGEKAGIALVLQLLGYIAWHQSEYTRATTLLEESLALDRDLDGAGDISAQLGDLGRVALAQGNYAQARALLAESLCLSRKCGYKRGIGVALNWLGVVAYAQGEDERAMALLEESLMVFQEPQFKRGIAEVLGNRARVMLHQGVYEEALELFEESLTLWSNLDDHWGIVGALVGLSRVAQVQSDYGQATTLLKESMVRRNDLGDKHGLAECLEGLAGVAAAQAQPERAARLWGTAEALREAIGAPILPVDRPTYDRQVGSARAQLDMADFAAAWAEGRAMPLDQAIAYALTDGR